MRRALWLVPATFAAVLLTLLVAGWRPVVLLSDSMAPTAPSGALLLARPVPPADVQVGDVVTVPVSATSRVTHRVVDLEERDGTAWARLRGDANPAPDPGRVPLEEPTLRVVMVLPGLGRLVGAGDPLLLAGLGLLLVGTAGLALVERRSEPHEPVAPRPPRAPSGTDGVDTRVIALLATLEALGADGMDAATLRALARVRIGALLGLRAVEETRHVRELDDGARFVVLALADADPGALALVPPGSRRAVRARAVVEAWWVDAADRVPRAVRTELADVLAAAAPRGGITESGPVD